MQDDRVVALRQPGDVADPLTDILRSSARRLLVQAVEAEVAAFFAAHADLRSEDGRQRLVRHGHLPEQTIQTGIGPVEVRQPRIRDRGALEGERIRFSPAILPPYARRTRSLDALLPVLYLRPSKACVVRGISTGDFQEALAALLGKDAPNLCYQETKLQGGVEVSAQSDETIWPTGNHRCRQVGSYRAALPIVLSAAR